MCPIFVVVINDDDGVFAFPFLPSFGVTEYFLEFYFYHLY